MNVPTDILIYIIGLLLAVVAYVGNRMVKGIDGLRVEIAAMDKHLAVMVEKINHNETKLMHFENRVSRIESNQLEIRERLHVIGNEINIRGAN